MMRMKNHLLQGLEGMMEAASLVGSAARRPGDNMAVDKDSVPRLVLHLEEALGEALVLRRIEIGIEGDLVVGRGV
jgi:hypothetical protein